MSTLWRRTEFVRIFSMEDLAKKAQEIEVTIPDIKVKRDGTSWIQIVSEASDQMVSQSLGLYRS